MSAQNRPLSPHLQVYKLPLTAWLSISHRISGVALSLGLLFFVYSFFAIYFGNTNFLQLQNLLKQPLGLMFVGLFIYALFFHLCHGVRHLIWDMGAGFEKKQMNQAAFIELAMSVILTIAALIFIGA
jgi:succinate dehydrogenase / fumarate reductase, cytochrome b subunit